MTEQAKLDAEWERFTNIIHLIRRADFGIPRSVCKTFADRLEFERIADIILSPDN